MPVPAEKPDIQGRPLRPPPEELEEDVLELVLELPELDVLLPEEEELDVLEDEEEDAPEEDELDEVPWHVPVSAQIGSEPS